MAAVGIVAEYNPFHNGHLYHLAETKRRFPDHAVICVMSGNFVQRGEPALLSKNARAAMAAECGADLVFELPVAFANAPAEIFASRAVALLAATGEVTALSFGSECGDIELLQRAADEGHFDRERFLQCMDAGLPYASARSEAYPSAIRKVLTSPNNLLAIEYIRAAREYLPNAELFTVSRSGAAHDGKDGRDGIFSASKLREMIRSECSVEPYVPTASSVRLQAAVAEGRCPVSTDALAIPLLAALRRMSPEEAADLPEISEGLEHRLLAAADVAVDRQTLLDRLKTKRYTQARLRRILISAYLGLRKSDQAAQPQYLRLLAATKRGTALLKTMRKTAALPIIVKPASVKLLQGQAVEQYTAEARADSLYALAFPNANLRGDNNFFRNSPYIAALE